SRSSTPSRTTPTPVRPWPTSRPSARARAASRASASPTSATATTSPTACCSPGPRWACTWPWPPRSATSRAPRGLAPAYLAAGNNSAHGLLFAGAKMGMHVAMATPVGYEPIPQVVRRATEIAAVTGGSVALAHDPATAAKDADVLYTDVWASMGKEMEHGERALIFKPYQLSTDTVMAAAPDAMVLHCLPAHRGEEIAAAVMDGPNSAVFDQAENRLHTQKALLSWLLTGSADPS